MLCYYTANNTALIQLVIYYSVQIPLDAEFLSSTSRPLLNGEPWFTQLINVFNLAIVRVYVNTMVTACMHELYTPIHNVT